MHCNETLAFRHGWRFLQQHYPYPFVIIIPNYHFNHTVYGTAKQSAGHANYENSHLLYTCHSNGGSSWLLGINSLNPHCNKMSKCFSLTASKTRCYIFAFSNSGLRLTVADLGDGTVMHSWVPKTRREDKPNLVLIHGFGANALWQWADVVRAATPHFNVYVPDLVFFGGSYTTRPERSEAFQARCVMGVLLANRVGKMVAAGMSYGGFVAYSMAAQWPEAVERVVLCSAGVCLEERDLAEGLFPVSDVEEAARLLLPRTAAEMRELMRYTLVKPPWAIPSCILQDYIDEMFSENVEEKKELLRAIPKGRKLLDLPKIHQPTLIIWGDLDRVFPLELGYRLKSHLGGNAELVVIKNAGHALNVDKPKELEKHLKAFLFSATRPPPSTALVHPITRARLD